MLSLRLSVVAVAAAAVVAACGGGGENVVGPPGGPNGGGGQTPTPVPQRLYVSDPLQPPNSTAGTIYAFALPVTASSTPVAVLSGTSFPEHMAFDPTQRLFVVNGGAMQVFSQPIVSGAAPAFTIAAGEARSSIAFDAQGNAYFTQCTSFVFSACYDGEVDVLTAPLSSVSTVQFALTKTAAHQVPFGLAFDKSGNLWVSVGGLSKPAQLFEYSPPINSASVVALKFAASQVGTLAFDAAGNLYIAGASGVDVYMPPFRAASSKAFTVPMPHGGDAFAIAFDAAGKAYVSDSNGNIQVFTAPLSAGSVPVATLPLALSPTEAGVAIGP